MRPCSEAVKADVRRRMSPPLRQSVAEIAQEPGLIQSVSQAPWPWLPAWVEVSGLAPALCLKPLLLQLIST